MHTKTILAALFFTLAGQTLGFGCNGNVDVPSG
jgi:hypothetical protein